MNVIVATLSYWIVAPAAPEFESCSDKSQGYADKGASEAEGGKKSTTWP